jgi:outer membrane protein TolC
MPRHVRSSACELRRHAGQLPPDHAAAFQQVEDNLAALGVLAQETKQQQQAVAAVQESLQLSTNRYKGGVDTYLQVITAQTLALTNERNAVDILRRQMDASALLIKAIGAGWNVSNLPPL